MFSLPGELPPLPEAVRSADGIEAAAVRAEAMLSHGDYSDPGWHAQPAGTQAFEWTGPLPEPERFAAERPDAPKVEMDVRKPQGGHGHHHH